MHDTTGRSFEQILDQDFRKKGIFETLCGCLTPDNCVHEEHDHDDGVNQTYVVSGST